MHLMVYHCNYTIQSFTGIAGKMSQGEVIGSWLTACEPCIAYRQIFDPLLQIMKVTLWLFWLWWNLSLDALNALGELVHKSWELLLAGG